MFSTCDVLGSPLEKWLTRHLTPANPTFRTLDTDRLDALTFSVTDWKGDLLDVSYNVAHIDNPRLCKYKELSLYFWKTMM